MLSLLFFNLSQINSFYVIEKIMRYHPKELVGGFDVNLTDGTVSSLDSWCLGCIIYEIHNGRLNSPKDIRKLGAIDQEIVPVYRKLLMTKVTFQVYFFAFQSPTWGFNSVMEVKFFSKCDFF